MGKIKEKAMLEEFNEFIFDIIMEEQEKKKRNKLKNRIKKFFKKLNIFSYLKPISKKKKQLKIEREREKERQTKTTRKGIISFLLSFFSIFNIFKKKKVNKQEIFKTKPKKTIEEEIKKERERRLEIEEIEDRIEEERNMQYKPYYPKEKICLNV